MLSRCRLCTVGHRVSHKKGFMSSTGHANTAAVLPRGSASRRQACWFYQQLQMHEAMCHCSPIENGTFSNVPPSGSA